MIEIMVNIYEGNLEGLLEELFADTLIEGYKVVRGSRSFRPATDNALQSIRYRLGEWTIQDKKNHGPFAIFAEEKKAKDFIQDYDPDHEKEYVIIKVEAKESSEDHLWKKNPPAFSKGRYNGYYAVSQGITTRYIENCPEGTILVDMVKPIEVVC